MRPFLEKNVELSREYAGYFAPYRRVTDPMIDDYDAGMTTASVQELFTALRREMVPIVRAICGQPAAEDDGLTVVFATPSQLNFNYAVGTTLGSYSQRRRRD